MAKVITPLRVPAPRGPLYSCQGDGDGHQAIKEIPQGWPGVSGSSVCVCVCVCVCLCAVTPASAGARPVAVSMCRRYLSLSFFSLLSCLFSLSLYLPLLLLHPPAVSPQSSQSSLLR